MSGVFYQGDNLLALARLPPASVDLVYADGPFNTRRNFTMGRDVAFTDTWKWGGESETVYWGLRRTAPRLWSMLSTLVELHGQTGTSAYLTAMGARLAALGRVLKPTGSLYLHCDSTASHALCLLCDGVFGAKGFRNEITWKRSSGQGNKCRGWGAAHDTILFYAAGEGTTWNGAGEATDLWDDLPALGQSSHERTGYPTQKPEGLLERILLASSNEGDTVLDPYAGSGTSLVVAEQLGRRWIGMDMGNLARVVVEARLRRLPRPVDYEVVELVAAVEA